ncbi:MAG: hypothetical protein NXI10_05000 [bacterium]|nr:hypothetical protein [bacterium]
MSDFHCLEIEFPEVDFFGKKDSKETFHAHLYANKEEIELRLFFNEESDFRHAFTTWCGSVDWNKFGSYLTVNLSKNETNDRLRKIDLSESNLLGTSSGSNFYQNGKKYIVLKIDFVKFYWNPVDGETNTAEFYLDDKGFRVVEQFYSFLSPNDWYKNDGNFSIGRMNDSQLYYDLGNSQFRPEFNLVSNDGKENRVATITKEPKIQFRYTSDISEGETLLYGGIVLMLASFYHHLEIDYVLRRIHLPEHTITIKKLEQKNFVDRNGNLWGFGLNWDFNKFLQSNWQEQTLKNFELLSKAIKLFNQSHIVDDYSTFLIRYNIIEICDKQKRENEKFTSVLDEKQTKAKQNEALNALLETISHKDQEAFKKRWNDIQVLLKNKPMQNQLASFLKDQNIDPTSLPIELKALKELRNNIIHGSIEKVNTDELRKANILLYRISGILILNLMGISDWSLNTELS